MTQDPSNDNTQKNNENNKQDEIDLVKLFYLMLSNWYWFVLALIISIASAWLYNRYTMPTWRVSATLLIEEDDKGKSIMGTDKILEGFGLRPGLQNLDNQILILTSWSLIEKTLDELPFEFEYYTRGRINKASLYPASPVKVITDSSQLFPRDTEFEIKFLGENAFNITSRSGKNLNFSKSAAFGDTLDINGGKFRIEMADGILQGGTNLTQVYFILHSRDRQVESYRERLKATAASKEGTIVRLSLDGTNRKKDRDFLEKLIEVSLNNNLERKNLEAVRIIKFIEDQLIGISDSLNITEEKLQNFRAANKVMDMSAQGQQIIDQAMTLENEKARLIIESNYYEYLSDYLSKDNSGEIPVSPATMGITDPGLTKLVLELTDLQSQYFSKSMMDKNPMKLQIAQKLRNTRDALIETLKGVKRANELAMRENTKQIRTINASAVILPKTERELLGFQREFKLNDVLYSYLMEKMAEAQIQKASNSPDNEIVDRPRPENLPIAPKPHLTYLLALLAGLGTPFLLVITGKALNNLIKNEDDLTRVSDLPIAGYVPHIETGNAAAVLVDSFSPVAEAFRSMRSRIQFFTREVRSPVILVTSSIPGEGKTFTAINLAIIYSLMGKRTVLVEFDLRKPKICSQLEVSNGRGITTWLIGQDNIHDIIMHSGHQNLDIIPAGPVPPNPAELIASSGTSELIAELRTKYDYIILDSAPIGTVSDSMTLATLADATLILVRHGKTVAPLLSSTIASVMERGIKSLSIVMNDIRHDSRKYRYGYRNSYRYGVKYGYTNENRNSNS